MAGPLREIRFGIRDGDLRSATFKVWTPGKSRDVYIAAGELRGGVVKASLHQSGQYHIKVDAAVSGVQWVNEPPTSRFIGKWEQPEQLQDGQAPLWASFMVLMARFSLATDTDSEPPEGMVWIPAPSEFDSGVQVTILIAAPGVEVEPWPGRAGIGNEPVGTYQLADGASVWAVHHIVPITTELREQVLSGYYRPEFEEMMRRAGPGVYRQLLMGHDEPSSWWFVDVAVTVPDHGMT